MKLLRRLLTAATALSLASCATVPATPPTPRDNSNPALWVVKDHDTTVYLFGTFHLMRPEMQWFNDGVKAAFDASDTVVTEIPPAADPQAMAPLFAKYALAADGKTLTSRLTEAQRTTYIAEMTKLGLPWQSFERLDPAFVGITVALGKFMKSGAKVDAGSEKVLEAATKAAGKQTDALETAEQQVQWIDSVPMDEQIASLMETLTSNSDDDMERMVAAWNGGDPDALAAIMNKSFGKTPHMARLLLTDRNQRWAQWIDTRMKTPGTVFMAVGAGHLAGKGSVQDYLAQRGIQTLRVHY